MKLNYYQKRFLYSLIKLEKKSEEEFDEYMFNLLFSGKPRTEYMTLFELNDLGMIKVTENEKGYSFSAITSTGRGYRDSRIFYWLSKAWNMLFSVFCAIVGVVIGGFFF